MRTGGAGQECGNEVADVINRPSYSPLEGEESYGLMTGRAKECCTEER